MIGTPLSRVATSSPPRHLSVVKHNPTTVPEVVTQFDTSWGSGISHGFRKILQSRPRLDDLIDDLIVQETGRHEAELTQPNRRLRELELITQDYDKNPVTWVQKQLEKLFAPHT